MINALSDRPLQILFGTVTGFLSVATVLSFFLKEASTLASSDTAQNLVARIKSFWIIIATFGACIVAGEAAVYVLFAIVSLVALIEFANVSSLTKHDRQNLLIALALVLPWNYWLVATWYGFFTVFVPVYVSLCMPMIDALRGRNEDFLSRNAQIQFGLIVFVYSMSYVPAILTLHIPGYESQSLRLLCYLIFVVQMSDVLQYACGKLFGKHKLAPHISPNKTVEGLVGGIWGAVALGTGFYWLTPFSPWQAALMSLLICLCGFGGGIVMSATKRDRGVKDYSALIPGHGGMIDRIDSLCFAAPIFFHVTRYLFAH